MHRVIQLEYSISTCLTKVYMVYETRNKNNCTAVRKIICRVQIVIESIHNMEQLRNTGKTPVGQFLNYIQSTSEYNSEF